MPLRSIFAILFALVAAAACVKLGLWQLDRLDERRAHNAIVLARVDADPVPVSALGSDTTGIRYRRVRLDGEYDFEHEFALTGRSRDGSPGVHLITPLRVPGVDRPVLVNRGWVYSPDAARVDLGAWRTSPEAEGVAYVELFGEPKTGVASSASNPRAVRWIDSASVAGVIPYPVAPYYVVLLPDSGQSRAGSGNVLPGREAGGGSGGEPQSPGDAPGRLTIPDLGEGPHLGYAIQWFIFASVAVIGVTLLLLSERGSRSR